MSHKRKVVGILMFLLVFLVGVQLVIAEKTIVEPNEGDIIPGPFEEWRVEYVYLYTINYGPWEEIVTHYCYSQPTCYVERTVSHCSPTALWGSVKAPVSSIETELGFSIGVEDCEEVTCGATCYYGQAVTLYWRYKQPIYRVVQRKYIIDSWGREYPTDDYAYAYAREEETPECKSVSNYI
ncbi:hypothetical protein DRN32_00455 [Thermococci archaeon]|nr:MAG: hypothetical protein DRN32_00455 [Thermococci archaeon]